MIHRIRLSRVNHPRASLVAIILLVVVFGLFGAIASALHPELNALVPTATPTATPAAAPDMFDRTALHVNNWIFGS